MPVATKREWRDQLLILGGIALSALLVSANSKVQGALRAIPILLMLALITGSVCLLVARLIRTRLLAILVSVVIVEVLLVLFAVSQASNHWKSGDHAEEELAMVPMLLILVTAPTVVLAAVGFCRIASRFFQERAAKGEGAGPKRGEN